MTVVQEFPRERPDRQSRHRPGACGAREAGDDGHPRAPVRRSPRKPSPIPAARSQLPGHQRGLSGHRDAPVRRQGGAGQSSSRPCRRGRSGTTTTWPTRSWRSGRRSSTRDTAGAPSSTSPASASSATPWPPTGLRRPNRTPHRHGCRLVPEAVSPLQHGRAHGGGDDRPDSPRRDRGRGRHGDPVGDHRRDRRQRTTNRRERGEERPRGGEGEPAHGRGHQLPRPDGRRRRGTASWTSLPRRARTYTGW